ncbi:hypothetical protein AVEN_187966-1, partial [Araneus ventricosus]
NIVIQRKVTRICSDSSGGRTDVRDEHKRVRPSVIYDADIQRTEDAIRANRHLIMKELHNILLNVSMTALYKAMSVPLGHRKLRAHWIPKISSKEHQMKRIDFVFHSYIH